MLEEKKTNQIKTMKIMKRNGMIDNKAITLVALVVTIIVLIILAGVSISLVLGENGILSKARDGRNNYQIAANEEAVALANLKTEMDSKINGNGGGSGGGTGGDEPGQGESGYSGGAYNDPYIPEGFTHTGSEDWNSGYTITGNTGTANAGDQFVWVPCSTAETLPTGVVRFQKTLPATTAETDPNYKYNKNNYALHPSGGTNASVNAEDASVALIRNSVGRNGGFYIAKYEAGCPLDVSNNEIVPASSSTITDFTKKARSISGANPWNYISRVNAITASSNMVTTSNVTSCLISGECWDTALAWITLTADSAYATNSAGKGWYSDVSSYNKHATGYYGTNTNNIFDLGGNMYEWTTENCKNNSGQYAVKRGGYYVSAGSSYPAAHRLSNVETDAYSGDSFRVVLYK